MAALLLADGRVHRPFNWIISLSTANMGTGDDPELKLIEWSDETDYQADVAAGNMDDGVFVSVTVPGFSAENCDDPTSIYSALLALGGDYAGATDLA